MTQSLVVIKELTKAFGSLTAVDRVSFEIQSGQVVGFIGENGAGKTTTMRMMVTLELPDSGSIHIKGHNALEYPDMVRHMVGWMPDSYGVYQFMTVREYMDFFARAYGFRGAERHRRIDEVMEFTELNTIHDRPVDKLSKGMGQRLCLGRTLLPDPEILVLDEPAAGLDPKARIEFKNLVRLLADQGKTLFISSHILSELEQMCDSLLFISKGKIVHHGSSESLKSREGEPVMVRIELAGTNYAQLAEWVSCQPGISIFEQDASGMRIRMDDGSRAHLSMILQRLQSAGFEVCEFHREKVRLEDAFVDIINRNAGGGM
ncbi:MAG TPA: ABC transporter ATP-binding protein [Kiritimatiellia bacterium]|nr:ABC transporter ATP-binding protein [Kiritimatiellia bacterium]